MILAEGVLVVAAPLLAVVFALALFVAGTHLWHRRARGRRPGAARRVWGAPDSRTPSVLRRVA